MDVDGKTAGYFQNLHGKLLPIGHNNKVVGVQGGEGLPDLLGFHVTGLGYFKAQLEGGLFHRRRHQFPPPTLGSVRLGDHQAYVAGITGQGLQGGHCKIRSAHENYVRSFFQFSAALFFIFFLYMFRFNVLIRSI